jgi:two-component system sensor histidine kinase/response regulator
MNGGAEHLISIATLDQLGPWLVDYGQRADLTLLTEADWPGGHPHYQRFWCLAGPSLAVLIAVPVQVSTADQVVVQLSISPPEIAALLQDGQPSASPPPQFVDLLQPPRLDSNPAAQAGFMLAWLDFCTKASQATSCQPVQAQLDQQLDRSLLLNQVVTKIQASLDLSEILETTVAEVRRFLVADRLVIYQFDQDSGEEMGGTPDQDSSPLPRVRGHITYEDRADPSIKSVLHYSEQHCFHQVPGCRDRYLAGQTLAVPDVDRAYGHLPCLQAFLLEVQVKSKLVSPIVVGHQLWGLLIAHQCSQPRYWQPWEIEFLQHIGEHLAIAINQAQLYQQLRRQTHNLEACVIERTQDLRDALVAAQSANRAKGEFLATMSHELRTPLTYIIGMSATLLRWSLGELSPRQRDYLNTIHTSGEHLLSLINDILELSKLESGRLVLEVRPFSLSSLSRQSMDAFRAEAMANGLEVSLDLKIPPDQDIFVADPRRIRQILSNLISNAIKFTPRKGKVTLRVRRDQNAALFHVEDTGIGIPEGAQSLLFQKFQQLENVRQREYQGTGLGLALTKQLVDLHGGSINVTSQEGVGSIFTVRIPVQRPADQPPAPQPPSLEPLGGRIVLVEENEETASLICDMLTAADYQVVWIIDGSRVADQVDLLRPAAVIVTMGMTSTRGDAIIAALRHDLSGLDTKILALVDPAVPSQTRQARQAGANQTLSLPIDPQALLTAVNHLMTRAVV